MKAEIDSIEPDIAQFAYRRLKRRLHDLAISPSAGSTHFYEDLHSHSYSSSPTAFVPFLRERSSIGKLLTAEPFSPPTAGSLGKCRSRSVQRRGVMKTHAARLKKQPLKCGTPGVGSYGVKYPEGIVGKQGQFTLLASNISVQPVLPLANQRSPTPLSLPFPLHSCPSTPLLPSNTASSLPITTNSTLCGPKSC